MDQDSVGKVIHFYDKAGVAIVKLSKNVKIGDKLKFVKGDASFEQTVNSLQINHAALEEGKAGQEVGIKVEQPAKEGNLVYLVA